MAMIYLQSICSCALVKAALWRLTYGSCCGWLCSGGWWHCGGRELLGPKFIVGNKSVSSQTQVGEELNEKLVPIRVHRPGERGKGAFKLLNIFIK